jgi:type VI protein secretion system component VasA
LFSKYYQSELTYLRELGREFGRAYPNVAGMLAERGGDPDVERLLEGFAFLTARIRERLDDDVPEVIHTLTDLLFPHYLRTLPGVLRRGVHPRGRRAAHAAEDRPRHRARERLGGGHRVPVPHHQRRRPPAPHAADVVVDTAPARRSP